MICRIHQWNIGRALDEGVELNSRTHAHLRSCGDCQHYHATQRRLVSQLAQPAAAIEPPPFLRARVMNAIRSGEAIPVRNTWRLPLWATSAACVLLAVFLVSKQSLRPPALVSQPPILAHAPDTLPPFIMPNMDVTAALKKAHDQIVSPYKQEMKNLQNDLQSASNYLTQLAGRMLTSID
ncbi:MAG: hypothetical protein EXS24_04700 [Pedosphaera sp.]|nr:hypothetical protein [Pedosphaera sp.]